MLSSRVRQGVLGAIPGLVAIAALSGAALAYEPGVLTATSPGGSVGVPAGALPPPGLYMNNQFYFVTGNVTNPAGGDTGIRAHVPFYDAQFLWVPGWKFLGASYGALLMQPFVAIDASIPSLNFLLDRNAGLHNTYFQPLILSWNLGGGWFTSAGFGFYAPTGTINDAQVFPGFGTGGPGYDFWTFKPTWAISYLGEGWNLTANVGWEFNTANRTTHYQSGDVLYADFTATKKFGKLELGPVGYIMQQTSLDSVGAGNLYGLTVGDVPDSKNRRAGVGGLIGYDGGPVKLQAVVMRDFDSRNDCDCWSFFANLSFPLWWPDAPPKHTPLK